MGLTLYQNLENFINSDKALSKDKVEIDYKIEIKELKSIFEVNERDVSANLKERMERTPNDNIVNQFDLRLCIFWKKIYLILRTQTTTKEMLSKELFEFLSFLVWFIKRNEFSKWVELLIILEFWFYFELVLDKFEQIDYNNHDSIRIMFPLISSKLSIIESMIKIWFPKFHQYTKINNIDESLLDSLFIVPELKDFDNEIDNSTLLKDNENEQIREWIENCSSKEVKEGIFTLLSPESIKENLPYLYYKTLQQLKRMYEMWKNLNIDGPDFSLSQRPIVWKMQRSKEVVQLKMIQICWFLSKENISSIINAQFEWLNSSWDYLYFQLCRFKIIYWLDLQYLMGMCWLIMDQNISLYKSSESKGN